MEHLMGSVFEHLQRALMIESNDGLNRRMHYPVGWDPYFNDYIIGVARTGPEG
jgi:hypothetical protein